MITGLEKLYWMRKLISVVSFFCISVLLLTTFRLFKGGYLVGRFQQSLLGSAWEPRAYGQLRPESTFLLFSADWHDVLLAAVKVLRS